MKVSPGSPDGTQVAFVDYAGEGQWVLTRADRSDAHVALSDHDRIGLTEWLSWQPCLDTAGQRPEVRDRRGITCPSGRRSA
jgi:hypothetical protein